MADEPARMNIHTDTWYLNVDWCPCDAHFNDFVETMDVRDAAIFHFGTGAHHVVGIAAAEGGRNNAVLAVTASMGEYDAYVSLVVDQPEIGRLYKVWFGDVYQIDPRLLPEFDLATLFHLCEFRTAQQDAYGALTDLEVAQVVVDRLRPDGRVLFYAGSTAFAQATEVIAALEHDDLIVHDADFMTLRVYRKGPRA